LHIWYHLRIDPNTGCTWVFALQVTFCLIPNLRAGQQMLPAFGIGEKTTAQFCQRTRKSQRGEAQMQLVVRQQEFHRLVGVDRQNYSKRVAQK
jgi:hypothetical protein